MPSSGVQTCARSEEHTSELQSHDNLVCRLLLEKKNALYRPLGPARRHCPTRSARPVRSDHHPQRTAPSGLSPPTLPAGAATRSFFFFFNDPGPPEISPLPLHAPLPS